VRLRVIVVQVGLPPDLAEFLESFLAHEDDDDFTVLLEHVLEQFLVHLVDENLLVDIVFRFDRLSLRCLTHFIIDEVALGGGCRQAGRCCLFRLGFRGFSKGILQLGKIHTGTRSFVGCLGFIGVI